MKHVFVGFGFGPIQSGLFAKEAYSSGRFSEIAVAEVDPALVAAVRGNNDCYALNVATENGVEQVQVEGVTLLDPAQPDDERRLNDALSRATEIVTSLPSVDFFARGGAASVAARIAAGLCGSSAGQAIVYTAENNNHAAEILEKDVQAALPQGAQPRPVQYLNTVIGKMSQVINDPGEIARRGLAPVAPGFPRAFLVESFNRILISKITLPGFKPGITAFEEKDDLLPFEEAKLYGHNAIHTLLGFLAQDCGLALMSDLRARPELLDSARKAFIDESGAALVRRYQDHGDTLFTEAGFKAYAEDLLNRMTNPHLADTVARATRDPLRKLGRADRIFGAIRLCIEYGVEPLNLAAGALAGLRALAASKECPPIPAFNTLLSSQEPNSDTFVQCLTTLWGNTSPTKEVREIAALLQRASARHGA
jgi:mannitol-1-phosphate 5-dehydrogenase